MSLTVISTKCPFCGNKNKIVVNVDAYKKWQSGALIQNAFPKLSVSNRELLITGICDPCFPS